MMHNDNVNATLYMQWLGWFSDTKRTATVSSTIPLMIA